MFSLARKMPTVHTASKNLVYDALGLSANIAAVGSRITCNPPPQNTDEDWLALCFEDPKPALEAAGFVQDGNPEFYTGNDDGGFRSWRLGDVNVITTESPEFYEKFLAATHLAKRFNLLQKNDRIALFQAVLYGVNWYNLEN